MNLKERFKTDEHLNKYMGLLVTWANKYAKFGLGHFDDMLQDTMMVYLNACEGFDDTRGSKFGTYLYRSLKNEMSTKIKSKQNEQSLGTLSLDVDISDNDSFLDMVEDDRLNINPDFVIINLRYMGYTMEEIASDLGVSRRTAYRMLEEERKNFI